MTDDRTQSRTTRLRTDTAILERGTRRRALCKALLYRVVMLLTTVLIALAITGQASTAVDIGIATTVVKTAAYYEYERLWDGI
ncbi:DUF2061 domain-containing protein [Halopiger aswanensis]|uniref:Putative membrane protein DUF2061 n=1 Tax=Halopiger aswanensis TaxID=148449 RepID=A0A419WEW3_9EURY|nr:DUF2061 domain-containing protein [Halopiger aswanensis]RKD94021.1 putative membrane protein DUF2061 [Halopiger aswanensis]